MTNKSRLFNQVNQECLYDRCNIFQKKIHYWNWKFYIKNYDKNLKLNDILQCSINDLSNKISNQFKYYWNIEVENSKNKNRKPSLFYPIYKLFFFSFLINSMFCILSQISLTLQAVLIGKLIEQSIDLEKLPNSKNQLYFISFEMIILHFIYAISTNLYNSWSSHYSLKIRVALSGIIYDKILKLNKSAFLNTSAGQIINLITNDVSKLEMILHFAPYPIASIIVIILTVAFLWNPFEYSVLIGVLVLFSILPIQMAMGNLYSKYFTMAAKLTDARLRLMNELIPAIKIIKMYSWEKFYIDKVNEARKNEISKIKAGTYLFSVNLGLSFLTSKLVIYSCLITFVLFGNLLIAKYVFIAFALMQKMCLVSALYIPQFIRQTANSAVSLRRIRNFLILPETTTNNKNEMISLCKDKSFVKIKNLFATYDHIEDFNRLKNGIYNCSFSINNDPNINKKFDDLSKYKIILNNINFEVFPSELMTIVGSVGSGKTSILMAILNEINSIDKNSINVKGRISFACQDAWTFAGTVKENIEFGSAYDEKKYKEIVRICALERDMTLFPQGDQTIIGESGVSLSGGQRARINLARALYYDADIYLLDDPLSAVDPHVAKHIFKEAIQSYLKDKIVILVTHQLQFIKNSSKILLIKEGQQIAYGSYDDCVLSGKMEFSNFVDIDSKDKKNQTKVRTDSSSLFDSTLSINNNETIVDRKTIDSKIDKEIIEKSKSIKEENNEFKLKKRQAIKEEITPLQFSYKVYVTYFRLGLAGWVGPVLIVTFLSAQAIYSYSDYFLSLWTTSEERRNNETINSDYKLSFVDNLTQQQSILIYSALMFSLFILSLLRAVLFFKSCMNSSVKLHNRLFKKVIGSPIQFFEISNHISILLNRVSRDINIVDEILPGKIFDAISIMIIDVSISIMIILLNAWLFIPLAVLMILVLLFRNLYLRTAKNIRMLEGAARSPVVQHTSSTINGLVTVRAFRCEDRFNEKFHIYQNDHSSCYFMYTQGIRWFIFVLDSLQVIFITGVLIVVIQFSDYLNGSTIGLIVSSALLFCSEFQLMVKNISEGEIQLTSVERLDQYSTLEQEPILDKKSPFNWPQEGSISFENVTMKYFEDEEPVLKNLNFKIEAGQKIGVVGRTGAGKSSIISTLFRMYDYQGKIIIDDIDISKISLYDLRSKLSIIPQDPVLFTGTIRSNLDPFNRYEDYKLWNVLKQTQLDKFIQDMNKGLESIIADNGSNFSQGQKQLICLARALLRKSKILVLDEATANCDFKTDKLIQNTIRTAFKNATIITVAHRLNTIIDSDKILVMDSGEVKEFDSPYNLLQDSTTIFSSLVDASRKRFFNTV